MIHSSPLILASLVVLLLAACGGSGKTDPSAVEVRHTVLSSSANGGCLSTDCSPSSVFKNPAALVWSYKNESSTPVILDINFRNLMAGQEITYVFGNGFDNNGAILPGAGVADFAGEAPKTTVGNSTLPLLKVNEPQVQSNDAWHFAQDKRRQEWQDNLTNLPIKPMGMVRSEARAMIAQATPPADMALGTSKVWTDTFGETNVDYTTTARLSCNDSRQRRIVFWADSGFNSATSGYSSSLALLGKTMCGSTGAIARMASLLGNVWGPHASVGMISDDTAPQDVNIVIVSPTDAPWAGYFSGGNSFKKSVVADSNEAVAFFVNADIVNKDIQFANSTLVHELTHMVNWYERSVRRGLPRHNTWMEEMSAMMTEDVLSSTLTDKNGLPYNKITGLRLPYYLSTGAGLSMVNWVELKDASGHYGMAGSLGAYLNRRFGLGIYKDMVTECTGTSSWDCLDNLIKKYNGPGMVQVFNEFGAAVFGLATNRDPASQFTYPARVDGLYPLPAVDLQAFKKYRPSQAAAVINLQATSHTYLVEAVNVGIFTYTRRGIKIPPFSSLNVLVR